MSGRRILNEAQLEEMGRLREKGRGIAAIARHFTDAGTLISPAAISWQCLRLGYDAPPRLRWPTYDRTRPVVRNGRTVRLFTPEDGARLIAMDRAGERVARMAKQLGRKDNSIRGRLYTLARREARSELSAVAELAA